MGVFGFLSRLVRRPISREDDDPIPDEVVEMAAAARGASVTPGTLANRTDRSDRPIVEYMADDEQPEFVLHGNQVLISNDDSYTTEHPTRDTQVVISDRRILILLGGRLSDDLWEVPLSDLVDAYVDDESWKRYLVVEADREDQRMTFFVDVTMESNTSDLEPSVEFVLSRGQ